MCRDPANLRRRASVIEPARVAPVLYILTTARLLPTRCAGRHPDVRPAESPLPARGEDQRPSVARETRLLLGRRRVQSPDVRRRGPRVVHTAAGGCPKIGPPETT